MTSACCRSACSLLLMLILSCQQRTGDPGAHWLLGSWSTQAFNGELRETWTRSNGSALQKEGYYIEGGDTLYTEKVRIDSLLDGTYLIAQPLRGDPAILRLTLRTDSSMSFSNPGNRYPYRILYERNGKDGFIRTTFGIEQRDTLVRRFSFRRTTPAPALP